MPDLSFELSIFFLLQMFFWNVMASSKNNENTLPLLGGSLGERIFYIITLITFRWRSKG
jgi:hypothetical protein